MARMLVVLALLVAGAALAAALLAHRSEAATAAVQIQRTFVSTSGSDANPCTRTEPCRNFQAALANTLAGGEVVALDSGGYGPMAIDKAVSVIGSPGAHVAISVFSGVGINVNAGSSDTVVLRNIFLTGLGGSSGISYSAGGRLQLERVTAAGFSNSGVLAAAVGGYLVVLDSTFRRNDVNGLLVNVAGKLTVQIERSRADQNGTSGFEFTGSGSFDGARGSIVKSSATGNLWGFHIQGGSVFAISDSTAVDNTGGGVGADGQAQVSLDRMVLSSNNGAVRTFGSATIRVGSSLVASNSTGFWNQGGTIATFQDNLLGGNTFPTIGTITTLTKG